MEMHLDRSRVKDTLTCALKPKEIFWWDPRYPSERELDVDSLSSKVEEDSRLDRSDHDQLCSLLDATPTRPRCTGAPPVLRALGDNGTFRKRLRRQPQCDSPPRRACDDLSARFGGLGWAKGQVRGKVRLSSSFLDIAIRGGT